MIESDLRELERHFGGRVDWESLRDAYFMRDKYPGAMIPSAIDTYLIQNAQTPLQKNLAKMAKAHYRAEIEKFAKKLKKYEQDVKDFEAKIKVGSKAKGLVASLEKRRETVQWHKEKIEYYEKIEEQGAPRVFPNFFAPVIVQDEGYAIRFKRYHLCPKSGKELTPFKYNLFNARKDRLLDARTWKPIFGKQHALFPFYRFYESVEGETGEAQIIYFQPENEELMWAAALFETTKVAAGTLHTFAAITDEPPPEVAETGHDRCPVFLAEEYVDPWLNPGRFSQAELLKLLDSVVPTYFKHELAG